VAKPVILTDTHGHDHGGHDHGGHDHDHGHAFRAAGERRVAMLLVLVVGYMLVEIVGGWKGGSLALLADAGHMASDAAALAITLWALRIARRPATAVRTYGWHRAEILAAAEALLVERGLDGTTMEDIARKSEFAVGSLYRFFASKEELVEALVIARTEVFATSLEALAANAPSYADALDGLLVLHGSEVQRTAPLMQFLLSGKHRLSLDPAGSPLKACLFGVIGATEALVGRGVREGVLAGDPHAMAVVLLALLDGFSRHALISGDPDLAPKPDVIRAAFHDGFRRRNP
jgi:AcrR family transcriptional regulator